MPRPNVHPIIAPLVAALLSACADSASERTLAPAAKAPAAIDIASLNQVACPPTVPPGYQLITCFDFDFQPGVWHGFIIHAPGLPNQLSHQYLLLNPVGFTYIPVGTPPTGARSEYTFQPEFNGQVWYDVVRFMLALASPPQRMTIAIARATNNLPPIAVPGGPYTGNEGAAIAFDGSASSDPEHAALTYLWDFGDGTLVSGRTATHTYLDNGTYQVRLTVNDGTHSHSDVTTATVANVAPTGIPRAPSGWTPGKVFRISLAAQDASPTDQGFLQYRFNCGFGWTPAQSAAYHDCVINTPGTYTLRFQVRDKDGGSSQYQQDVSIAAATAAPVVTLTNGGPITIPVGGAVTLNGSFTDGAADGPWTARAVFAGQSVSLGNVVPGQGITAGHVFSTAGTYQARLEIRDAHGVTGVAAVTVIVQ
jgi:PKD domain